jgi:hypothetical protein
MQDLIGNVFCFEEKYINNKELKKENGKHFLLKNVEYENIRMDRYSSDTKTTGVFAQVEDNNVSSKEIRLVIDFWANDIDIRSCPVVQVAVVDPQYGFTDPSIEPICKTVFNLSLFLKNKLGETIFEDDLEAILSYVHDAVSDSVPNIKDVLTIKDICGFYDFNKEAFYKLSFYHKKRVFEEGVDILMRYLTMKMYNEIEPSESNILDLTISKEQYENVKLFISYNGLRVKYSNSIVEEFALRDFEDFILLFDFEKMQKEKNKIEAFLVEKSVALS